MTGQAVEGNLPDVWDTVSPGGYLGTKAVSVPVGARSYPILSESSEACTRGLRNSADKSHPRNQKNLKMCLEVAYLSKKQLLSPYYLYISCNWKYKYKASLYSFNPQEVILTQKLILRVSCAQAACQCPWAVAEMTPQFVSMLEVLGIAAFLPALLTQARFPGKEEA